MSGTQTRRLSLPLGLGLVAGIAALAFALAQQAWFSAHGVGVLALAIVLGIALGNTVFPSIAGHCHAGVDFARSRLLRIGVVLFGFRISLDAMLSIGWPGLLVDLIVVISILSLALWAGPRWFKLDRQSALLIGVGSAICGAAAVVACEPILRAPAHKTAVAVATVVVFGTLAMFLYPMLQLWLALPPEHYALYVGSTVHEVAQVVVAAGVVPGGAELALVEKMFRVVLLVPVLFWLVWTEQRRGEQSNRQRVALPWFALMFLLAIACNSLITLPAAWQRNLQTLDTLFLAMAMAALGLRTHFSSIRRAGSASLALAGLLFAALVVGGGLLNWLLIRS